MSLNLQNLLILLAVGVCVVVIGWQIVRTFRGAGKFGSCCGKGCESQKQSTERVAFLPSDDLRKKTHS